MKNGVKTIGDKSCFSAIFKPEISALRGSDVTRIKTACKILDFLLSPFEHYMISLEEFKKPSFRNATTRCGMVVERIIKRLWPEVVHSLDMPYKVEDQLGRLQEDITKLGFSDAQDTCNVMKVMYHKRDRRGPHDVPAAEELDAKFCINGMLEIYPFYLSVIEHLSYPIADYRTQMENLLNELVLLKSKVISGVGGKGPSEENTILSLYQKGFFSTPKSLGDVMDAIGELDCKFLRSTVFNILNRLHSERVLTRSGRTRSYRFQQRVPPQEYYR